MMEMFNQCADEIFKKAGLTKEQAPTLHEDVVSVMSQTMARLSATMGLSKKRFDAYDEQKQTLVDDLIKLREAGTLR